MSIQELLGALKRDEWRITHPFSDDIVKAHAVLLDPFALDVQRAEALRLWMHKNQPCLFGGIAAATKAIHVCVLSEDDIRSSDEHIRGKVDRARELWKRGSLRNERPEHGFVLAVASQRVAFAAPDGNLKRFADHLRKLVWDDHELDEIKNDLTWETLFLQNPDDKSFVRFRFSVDYFGAQGDGRWWHDHRVPGGIAFTANSVGHMARTREWYEGMGPQTEWIVEVAMGTVAKAAETEWGRAIWLEDLGDGQPQRGATCPFANPEKLKPGLTGKDWSIYRGYHSTDHSIRDEFFHDSPERPAEIVSQWILDLLYLYDPGADDHAQFVAGEAVTEDQVYAVLGPPESWRVGPIPRPRPQRRRGLRDQEPIASAVRLLNRPRRALARRRIQAALEAMRREWG